METEMIAAQLLYKNNTNVNFDIAAKLLIRLANNVLENPLEMKYRRLRVGNPIIESKLLPLVGAMECLFEMGFKEDAEYLTLPITSSLSLVRTVRDELLKQSGLIIHNDSTDPSVVPPPPSPLQQVVVVPGEEHGDEGEQSTIPPGSDHCLSYRVPSVGHHRDRDIIFLRRLTAIIPLVSMYEDASLQQKAAEAIPVGKLKELASAMLASPQRPFSEEEERGDFSDCFLLQLLHWFKMSFFSWVDCLPCKQCGAKTHFAGNLDPLPSELTWGGSRVEMHQCDECGAVTRFPRYNHPGKLLDTRCGRCGEWANCFTLCCRAVGFEARYVVDWGDHVWTEAYSFSQQRWLHCDPCENVCDRPLLYEVGWRKTLSYVIAFSADQIQDVTWRYSAKHGEVLARRHECDEMFLVCFIHNYFKSKLAAMSEGRRQEMLQRLVVELVEFLTIKSADGEHSHGRTSGSLQWRKNRGEVGDLSISRNIYSQPVLKLVQKERYSKMVQLRYNCAQDQYTRPSAGDSVINGWHSLAHGDGVFRKVEHDWMKVYLSREGGVTTGMISWIFDLAGEELFIQKVDLKAESVTYGNGTVDWTIRCDKQSIHVSGTELWQVKTFDLSAGQALTITATLSGGNGDHAWQHAQLFRQSFTDELFTFDLTLHLR